MKTEDRRKLGKKTRAQGGAFELRVRKDLESKGWIVDKWTNNVEFEKINGGSISDFIRTCSCGKSFGFGADYNGINGESLRRSEERAMRDIREHFSKDGHSVVESIDGAACQQFIRGKLVPAKAKWNNFTKSMMMGKGGFPDFIIFKHTARHGEIVGSERKIEELYDLIGVESKMAGKLDKPEKDKCRWYLDNQIFSRILIAEKTKVKNRVVIVYNDFENKYGTPGKECRKTK